jgi:hypothetical protein
MMVKNEIEGYRQKQLWHSSRHLPGGTEENLEKSQESKAWR